MNIVHNMFLVVCNMYKINNVMEWAIVIVHTIKPYKCQMDF